jgi:hypothetical protein
LIADESFKLASASDLVHKSKPNPAAAVTKNRERAAGERRFSNRDEGMMGFYGESGRGH